MVGLGRNEERGRSGSGGYLVDNVFIWTDNSSPSYYNFNGQYALSCVILICSTYNAVPIFLNIFFNLY